MPPQKRPKTPSEVESAPKKGKSGVQCSLCERKPSAMLEWGRYETRAGGQIPLGSSCKPCLKLWERCFLYLPWDDFAKFGRSQELIWGSSGKSLKMACLGAMIKKEFLNLTPEESHNASKTQEIGHWRWFLSLFFFFFFFFSWREHFFVEAVASERFGSLAFFFSIS